MSTNKKAVHNDHVESENACEVYATTKHDLFHLIPEGTYEVIFVKAETCKAIFGPNEARRFFHWQISQMGEHQGKILFQSYKDYGQFGSRSKYYHDWTVAAGRRPTKRDKMKIHVFKEKVFRALVRTVKPMYESGPLKGKEKPQQFHYSIVDMLIEKITS